MLSMASSHLCPLQWTFGNTKKMVSGLGKTSFLWTQMYLLAGIQDIQTMSSKTEDITRSVRLSCR